MAAKVKRKESGGLSSRDLIALGVFSLLFMVVSMLVVGITSMSVVAYTAAAAPSQRYPPGSSGSTCIRACRAREPR